MKAPSIINIENTPKSIQLSIFLAFYMHVIILQSLNSKTLPFMFSTLFYTFILLAFLCVLYYLGIFIKMVFNLEHSTINFYYIIISFILPFIFYIFLYSYITTFIHEIHHVFFDVLNGCKITDFHVAHTNGLTDYSHPELSNLQIALMSISAPVGTIFLNLILIFFTYRSKKINRFFFTFLYICFNVAIISHFISLLIGPFEVGWDAYTFITELNIPCEAYVYIVVLLFSCYLAISVIIFKEKLMFYNAYGILALFIIMFVFSSLY